MRSLSCNIFRESRLTIISAVLLAACFPPLRTGFIAYIALVPLIVSLRGSGIREGFRRGWVFGFVFNAFSLYWINFIPVPWYIALAGYLALVLFQSLYPALFGAAFGLVSERLRGYSLFTVPFLWVSMEYLRSAGLMGFPWLNLSLSQSYWPPLLQVASLTGATGVSFWIAGLNAVVAWIWIRRYSRPLVFAGIVIFWMCLGSLYLWGSRRITMYESERQPLDVALIQANISPEIKWDEHYREHSFDVFIEETEKAAGVKLDLVIWPETATPCYLRREYSYRRKVVDLVREHGLYLLTGTPDYERIEGGYNYYNSAFLFSPEGEIVETYAKLHLVPFGEMIPLEDHFEALKRIDFGEGDFSAAEEFVVFPHPGAAFATIICFESIFPRLVREFVLRGAEMLVVITNDCWFGKTAAPYQHAMSSVLRAVEHGIPVARCANTGVSMLVDPLGRVTASTGIFVKTTVVGSVQPGCRRTLYSAHGEWLEKISGVVALFYILFAAVLRKPQAS